MSNQSINIGILGLGTVGRAVLDLLQSNAKIIADRAGAKIKVVAVCDVAAKASSINGVPVYKNAEKIISNPKIDIVVEAIGGTKPALEYILRAISNKKHIVTSNKEVIAKHMPQIYSAAQKNGVVVLCEAAVAGGIPILNSIRDNLAANHITEIYGIVNGTTNYILYNMTEHGVGFKDALKAAQKQGFAEANPSADIDGYDAMYKAVILAAVAFGTYVNYKKVSREGIARISQEDIQYAKESGYAIKLIATVRRVGSRIDVRVHPVMVPKDHPLAKVSENYNAIFVKSDFAGDVMFYGQGAGGKPTASSVVADIINIAQANCCVDDCCGEACDCEQATSGPKAHLLDIGQIESRYYINLKVPDRSGVLAEISRVFARHQVSIQAVSQPETNRAVATLIIVTHLVRHANLQSTLRDLKKLSVVKTISNVVRVGL
ncbi:MAG: homoserine dehydrogenase [Candidatus Margulisiibacteriota bacterium]